MAASPRRGLWGAVLFAAALAAGPAAGEPLEDLVAQCVACHGDAAQPPALPEAPILGGQPELYALYQLVYFRQGVRKQAEMNALVGDLDDDTLRGLARWIAALPAPPVGDGAAAPARYDRGAALAERHRCGTCHDAAYAGRRNIPRLAGQRETYLLKALKDFRAGARIGIQAAMAEVLTEVDDPDLEDLAHFLAHFRP